MQIKTITISINSTALNDGVHRDIVLSVLNGRQCSAMRTLVHLPVKMYLGCHVVSPCKCE